MTDRFVSREEGNGIKALAVLILSFVILSFCDIPTAYGYRFFVQKDFFLLQKIVLTDGHAQLSMSESRISPITAVES
jgi:hypothetical protein